MLLINYRGKEGGGATLTLTQVLLAEPLLGGMLRELDHWPGLVEPVGCVG
jgi:hypothetical protein